MFDRLRTFLTEQTAAEPEPDSPAPDRLQLAAAVLLVEVARMDDVVDEAERQRIAELIRWRFKLSPEATESLVGEALRVTEGAAQWYGFTATINGSFAPRERVMLVEMLWDVVYADGQVHDLEANMMRRVAALLHVSDADSGAARRRAQSRYD